MRYIDLYLEGNLTFTIRESALLFIYGWYIKVNEKSESEQHVLRFLWKDFKIHDGVDYKPGRPCSQALGLYCSKREAIMYLQNYKEKQNMSEIIEINVKVNGEVVPLSTISTETFKNIKAKEQVRDIPRYRKGKLYPGGSYDRILIRCADDVMRAYNKDGEEKHDWSVDDDIKECRKMYYDVVPILS